MQRFNNVLFCSLCCCSLLMICTPQPAIRREVSHEKCPPVSELPVDTIAYTISFSDEVRRDEFVESFRSFLNRYPFSELRDDSIAGQILVRLAPVASSEEPLSLSTVEPASFSGSTIEPDSGIQIEKSTGPEALNDSMMHLPDTIVPEVGGKLRLFTQRTGIDGTLLPLVAVDPFLPPDSLSAPFLTVVNVSPKKITLQLGGRIVDGAGRLISALDLIEAWTGYIKSHPAEGWALFRHVEGMREFIAGREAVIRGLGAVDQKTCYLRLSQPDSSALDRIRTARISGSIHAKWGVYYPVRSSGGELVLAPNLKSGSRRAFLDTLIITAAEDRNPILSFSLKKYDALLLTSSSDISYARTTLENRAAVQAVSRDRYFIACAVDDEKVRRYLASRVKPAELLGNVVKAEGRPLAAIETDTGFIAAEPAAAPHAPPVGRRLRILFRKDDPVSCTVAEKLLADLSGNGIRSTLAAAAVTEYERALVERSYECAIGWVPDRIRSDPSERLRLAAIWFADETAESERIASCKEIPLFSVERYLLIRKPAGLYRGSIVGIFASSRPVTADAHDEVQE
ncbi:MAG: hypothetical protein JW913_05395 [Chitinispirillaceae bacterium]|nr:hypothetical protein [Chitinispirillaceae bacterium]